MFYVNWSKDFPIKSPITSYFQVQPVCSATIIHVYDGVVILLVLVHALATVWTELNVRGGFGICFHIDEYIFWC